MEHSRLTPPLCVCRYASPSSSQQDLRGSCSCGFRLCGERPHSAPKNDQVFFQRPICVRGRTYQRMREGAQSRHLLGRTPFCSRYAPSSGGAAHVSGRPCSFRWRAAPSPGTTSCNTAPCRALLSPCEQGIARHTGRRLRDQRRACHRFFSYRHYVWFGGKINVWFGSRAIFKDIPKAIQTIRNLK